MKVIIITILWALPGLMVTGLLVSLAFRKHRLKASPTPKPGSMLVRHIPTDNLGYWGYPLKGYGKADATCPVNQEIPLTGRAFMVVAYTDEYGPLILSSHIGLTRRAVQDSVMARARQEGFSGSLEERLEELGWEICEFDLVQVPADPVSTIQGE